MSERYILSDDGVTPIPEPDLMKWARWLERPGVLVVKQEELPDGRYLSTVFFGLNMGYGGDSLLWETMLFDKQFGIPIDQSRCGGDRHNAERMHAEMLTKHTNAKS